MNMSDPIADLLTRIRNANHARLSKVEVPYSNLKTRLVEILRDEGFVRNFKVAEEESGIRVIKIFLKYDNENRGVINGIHRASRPGLRRYLGYRDLPKYKSGFGVSILTTSRGLMTDHQAREQHVGGEVLCSVW